MAKYICMRDGCDFLTSDRQAAADHMSKEENHALVKLTLGDERLDCCVIEPLSTGRSKGVLAGPDVRNEYAINTGDEGGEVDTDAVSGNVDRYY